MSNDGNITIEREPCFEARNFLESDFPEIFLAGLGCILLNIIFFLFWSLGDVFLLLEVLWRYRPWSEADDRIVGTRNLSIGHAKENVQRVFGDAVTFFHRRPHLSYWIGYIIIVIRALVGPLIEYVHMGVDVNNYVKLIDCQDTPISRKVRVNRGMLLGYLLFIVMGIMFLPISSNISLRRHREPMGSRRIKTFELIKPDVTLCLASFRTLFVTAIVDVPKYFLVYFWTEKFMTTPEDAGKSSGLFMLKNVSLILIWFITLCVVFARFNKNLKNGFFDSQKWTQKVTRYICFVILPLSSFLSQFVRVAGTINQVYFVQEDTFERCANTCIAPPVDGYNHTEAANLRCCKGPMVENFPEEPCLKLGINITANNTESLYYEQVPFNHHCLVWIDYAVIVAMALPVLIVFGFAFWAISQCWRHGVGSVRLYVNAIIDMGFPQNMTTLHYSAYYGDVNFVKKSLRSKTNGERLKYIDEQTQPDGNTALHLAAQNGFSEVCYVLVKEYNANMLIKNEAGYTPGDLAKLENYELIQRYLEIKTDKRKKARITVKSRMTMIKTKLSAIDEFNSIRKRPTSLAMKNISFQEDLPLDSPSSIELEFNSMADQYSYRSSINSALTDTTRFGNDTIDEEKQIEEEMSKTTQC